MIRRSPREANFTIIPNRTIDDSRLSWEALGLLTYLLSKPDNWTVRGRHLAALRTGGWDRMQRVLRELEANGYLCRKRTHKSDGTFGWESTVTDRPETGYPSVVEAETDQPETAEPGTGLPSPAKPSSLQRLILTNPDLTKTERTKTDQDTGAPFGLTAPNPLTPSCFRKRKTGWPEGFALTAEMRSYAEARGVDPEQEFAAFHDWAEAKGALYMNWPAAWRTRINNVPRFGGAKRVNSERMSPGMAQLMDALKEERARKYGQGTGTEAVGIHEGLLAGPDNRQGDSGGVERNSRRGQL